MRAFGDMRVFGVFAVWKLRVCILGRSKIEAKHAEPVFPTPTQATTHRLAGTPAVIPAHYYFNCYYYYYYKRDRETERERETHTHTKTQSRAARQ